MAQFEIKVDLSGVMKAARDAINAEVLPRLSQAVGAVAQQAMIDWKEAVNRAKLWSGEKQPYAQSITWRMTGPFSAEVSSDYKYAEEIETGRPAKDLKRMLDTSLKVRQAKNGKRYLIIPFRHGTPGSNSNPMPQEVYDQARQLTPSRITGTGRRLSGTGAYDPKTRKMLTVASRKYSWGDNLDFRNEETWRNAPNASKKHQNMYRFETSSGNAKSSAYLTFRVMVENAPGWIIPPKPGLYLVKGVTERLQPLAEKAFAEAIKRDLR